MVRVSTELSMKIFVWFSFSKRVLGCYLQSGSGYIIAVSYIIAIYKITSHWARCNAYALTYRR
jgi:hypothetical protein